MTNYPKPPEKTEIDPEVKKRKEERKKLLEEIRKKRAKVLKKIYSTKAK